jgi:anti-sigma B factor antagonist
LIPAGPHLPDDPPPRREDQLRGELRPRGPVRLALSERRSNGAAVIHVEGELDLLTAPRLAAGLDRIMREPEGDVVLDLTDTDFIDSVGLQMLLSIDRRLAAINRKLTVVCGDGPVRRQIETTRLITALNVVGSIEEYERGRRES